MRGLTDGRIVVAAVKAGGPAGDLHPAHQSARTRTQKINFARPSSTSPTPRDRCLTSRCSLAHFAQGQNGRADDERQRAFPDLSCAEMAATKATIE